VTPGYERSDGNRFTGARARFHTLREE
jgi:hypothetical protein